MKSIFSQISKSSLFNHVMRLAIVVVCLSYSAAAAASSSYKHGAYFDNVYLHSESTGAGTVYITATAGNSWTGHDDSSGKDYVETGELSKTTATNFHLYKDGISNGTANTLSGYLTPVTENTGVKFDGWYADGVKQTGNTYTLTHSTGNNPRSDVLEHITTPRVEAKFLIRTYEAYNPFVGSITLDIEGNVSTEVGGSVSYDGTNWSTEPIEAGTTRIPQNADDNGRYPRATFFPRFYAQPNAGYKLIGWATTPEEAADIYANNLANPDQKPANPYQNPDGIVSTAEQGSGATPPSLGSLYAVFAPSIYYYHLGAAVGIAGDHNEWDAKGRVYADNGEAIITGVPEDQWTTSMQDENVYSQENDKVFKYTYYAKVLDPTKVAFKGWTTSPNGEPSYFGNPLKDYEHTVTDDNTSDQKPFRTPTLYAVFESYYYKTPAVAVANNSKGAGFVNVSLTEGLSLDLCTKEEIAASTETHQVPATGTSHAYKVAYYAKNKPGTRFEYWSSTPDGSNIVSHDPLYVEDFETSATNADFPHVAPALYAVFSSDIDIRQQDRMIVYIDEEGNGNINDSKVLIDFQKGKTLTAALTGDDAPYFTLSNRSGSKSGSSITFDATQGLIELVVAYKGDLNEAVGKVANITLSATSGGQPIERPVTIVVEEAPIITFLPTDGKGAYKVSMTNGSGINYTMDAATKENIKVPITHESMSNIEIALQSDVDADDYYFFGWQMIDGNDVTYLSYEQLFTYQFTKPVTVRADFVHKDIATYYIVDDPTNTLYHDFALVMSDAEKLAAVNGTQTVMLNDVVRGAQVTKAVLPKGNYTIPTGVRFIVPGKTVRTYREALEQSDFTDSSVPGSTSYKEYIRWIVEEGTMITVEGGASVSVLANVIVVGASNANGLPYDYGHIELNQNCKMEFLGDSKLFAYGYVTGPESSSILMKDQSLVKEILQAYDWRGGTATSTGYLLGQFKNNKIFLINQYFVQNIEAPLTITAGATEELDAALNVNGIMNLSLTFISQNNGFFQLSNGYSFTKYYDKYSDRIRLTVEKEEGAIGTAELGSIALNISGIGEVNSADFVLPLPHNYDIVLGKNTVTNILHDIALLPGATCHIMEGATCNLGVSSTANLFVYDQKYSKVDGKGYMGSTDAEFFIIKSRPDKLQYTRTSATIQDAKLIVDGTLNTPNGYLYTTNYKTETTDHACITSNGGGKVQFNALGTKTDTKQGTHQKYGINVVSIPVAPARLLHGNGNYQEPSANTTYTYINDRWTANTAETEKPVLPTPTSNVPVFTVTNYTTSSYVGKSSTGTTTISTNNTNVDWAKVTWTYQLYGEHADQFAFAWATKPNGTITFTPESDGTKKATLRIIATYKYKDTYGVTGTYIYSKDIYLTGNASYLAANILAFADLSTLYKGQSGVALFTTGNNTQPITFTVNPANAVTITGNTAAATIEGNIIGKVTLTATQPADLTNNIAATTITKTIKVNDPVQWNWDILYLGEKYGTPITMLDVDNTEEWTLTEQEDKYNIIDFKGDAPNYTASVANLIAGSFEVKFTFKQGSTIRTFTSHAIVDPRHLRVDVNSDTIFRAVTLSANESVGYNVGQNGQPDQIIFRSTNSNISQWKLGFFGVPDKIHFQPNGTSAWQIEESPNGVNWTTSFPWKYIDVNSDFELSLLPSTRFLRISYGAGSTTPASLKELYITELTDVKADVEKLYMPVQKDANGSVIPYTKEVVLTYANTAKMYVSTTNPTVFKVKESTSNNAATDVLEIPATSEDNPFGIKGIEVVSTADKEMEGYLEIREGTTLKVQIPIQTYLFPQELPIKLATDKPDGGDRYYYVTTHTHNAEWDGRDNVRTITLNNAVSDAAPYLTFEYSGNPTYIGFNYSTSAKGTWELEQFINGNWAFVPHTPDNGDVMNPTTGTFKRFVNPNASKLRVIYQSEYAEKVNITDLVIVGDASAIVDPARMELDFEVAEDLKVTAINLSDLKVKSTNAHFKVAYVKNGTPSEFLEEYSLTSTDFAILNGSSMGDILFQVMWSGTNAIEHGTLELTASITTDGVTEERLLATVELVGMKQSVTGGDLGIYTGVASDYTLAGKYKADGVTLSGRWQGDDRRKVNIDAAFAPDGKALFDYVVIYGETTTSDGSKTINLPNTLIGSNAKTPCYIYKKDDTDGTDGTAYKLYKSVENANSKEKTWNVVGQDDADAVTIPTGKSSLSMYITGFCPYASTGYTKADEGVWYFRGGAGQSIDVYLQDCYIYSRAKTHDGHSFADRQDGNSFSNRYTCGSGAVLVFACNDKTESAMNVTIHTLDNNLLKSNYGCFLQSAAGRVYHVSPSVQIRLIDDTYYVATTTTLNFTDEWPASKNSKTVDGSGNAVRTNGFLSLQKQHNNAPSIDMGNARTVVNFNGGQVELQNAQIVSTNYVTTLAICHRTGKFAGVPLAYGLGTDGVGGTVNFNDGTTTVLPMEVAANYRQYYLMDTDAAGNELTTTSCLRTPEKTFVKGGSHCMMRACPDPTSKGGAPKDKAGDEGKLLGLYKFPKNPDSGKKGGWTAGENGLVNVVTADIDPVNHQVPVGYGVKSVTPNTNGTANNEADDYLNFWFDPDFEPSAKPEINVPITFWKTCMTRIGAMYGGYGGHVGGEAEIVKQNGKQEEIVNLMYCKMDENIHTEIRKETFAAPVKNPGQVGEAYLPIKPSYVSDTIDFYVDHEESFRVEQKVYYITTATADVWNAFTAPFDVKNIYIMETYPEQLLQDMEGTEVNGKKLVRKDIIQAQAKHNADFAAFFAVTVALGQQKDFETIYREYIDWAKLQDKASGAWDGRGTYTLRGKSALVPYDGTNWATADFYLNENTGPWKWEDMEKLEDGHFTTEWQFPDASDGKLMHQGRTYSMLLPFCTKCGNDINSREYWDYWSGKFLIFESTAGPHTINGSDVLVESNPEGIFATMPNNGEALLKGNSTFAKMETTNEDLFTFVGDLQHSTFYANEFEEGDMPKAIVPTESFLIPNIPFAGMRPRGVTTSGQIIYDNDGTTTGGNIPTVGGGNDLFITDIVGGVNIAVAEPQHVRVMSATGSVIFSGMVQTAVDVTLPATGVYVITGENEVHKILH